MPAKIFENDIGKMSMVYFDQAVDADVRNYPENDPSRAIEVFITWSSRIGEGQTLHLVPGIQQKH